MAKGPLLNEGVKRLTAEIYLQHKDWRAKEVRKELHSRLRVISPNTPDNWPALSTIQAILKNIIDIDKLVIERGIDEPWSMGACVKYDMPQNAIDSLMEVWKYNLATGHIFTIREAKWAARLSSTFTQRKCHISALAAYSREYANREQIYELLSKPMDTRDLDAACVMENSEVLFCETLGMIPSPIFNYKTGETKKAVRLFYSENAPKDALLHMKPGLLLSVINEIDTPDEYMNDLSEKQEYIYAAILVFLSKGPKWNTLSREDFLSLLSKIRACVLRLTQRTTELIWEYNGIRYVSGGGDGKPEDIIDTDILNMVGYEFSTRKPNKEAKDEGTHNKEG
jgi:hypothetical protein